MEKNKLLVIIALVLGGCLIGFCAWYGVNHFKGEEPAEENSSKVETPVEESDDFIINNELSSEFSKIHKFVYDYFLTWPYCGEYEKITVDDPVYDTQGISKSFKSFDELYNYLKKYMSEEVIKQNIHTVEENYYVKDGKLYCKFDAKGWVYEYQSNKVNIVSLTDTKAETKVIVTSKDPLESETYIEEFNVTFEKVNDSWIITKYERTK